jgi:hypothetical protein
MMPGTFDVARFGLIPGLHDVVAGVVYVGFVAAAWRAIR